MRTRSAGAFFRCRLLRLFVFAFFVLASQAHGQEPGVASAEMVRRALANNADLAASRLEIEKAEARVKQAGLRPNPTIEIDETFIPIRGTSDRTFSAGISLPFERGGKRTRRVAVAEVELDATRSEYADRERRLAGDVLHAYTDGIAGLRTVEILSEAYALQVQIAHVLEIRVTEGDAPPLDLNLLRVETERLKSRQALARLRLNTALRKLKSLADMEPDTDLRLVMELTPVDSGVMPSSIAEATEEALRARPDAAHARLNEALAQANVGLARAQAVPNLSGSLRYQASLSVFDGTPVGTLRDLDRTFSFGLSIDLPTRNRNQGAIQEAQVGTLQAERRRIAVEQAIRAEAASAYERYRMIADSARAFETAVIEQSRKNVAVIRAAYELGEFRITDLLTEQRRLVDLEQELSDLLAEGYRARADLNIAIGRHLQ